MVDRFVLNYPPPAPSRVIHPVNEAIRVERFSVAHMFDTTAMIYAPEKYHFEAYQYSRWRVGPGDMISDFLIRDLRSSSLFKAVFPFSSDEQTRYVLDGSVREFFETDENSRSDAVLVVDATLFDNKEKELTKRIVFQKTYQRASSVEERTPEGFAKGMSSSAAAFSEELMKDIENVLRRGAVR